MRGERLTADRIATTVAGRMAELRQERGLTLQEVADRAGITKSHAWEIERGRSRNPTIAATAGIASALGVSLDYLAGMTVGRPDMHPDAMRIACEVDAAIRAAGRRALEEADHG
jgi:transcriptional regulator with XRE-family HTH domain